MEKIKVIIIDDHKIIREGIKAILFNHPKIKVVAEGGNEIELKNLMQQHQPDIIIMDIAMPGKSGIELTSWLKENHPSVKVLILTSNSDEESIIASIQAGASGFLHKDSSAEELTAALTLIHEGEGYFSENISKIIYKSYISKVKAIPAENENKSNPLTEREIEIVKHFSNGLSYKEIAAALGISVKTVESHKVNILNKLEIKTTIDLVKYAIKNKIIQI